MNLSIAPMILIYLYNLFFIEFVLKYRLLIISRNRIMRDLSLYVTNGNELDRLGFFRSFRIFFNCRLGIVKVGFRFRIGGLLMLWRCLDLLSYGLLLSFVILLLDLRKIDDFGSFSKENIRSSRLDKHIGWNCHLFLFCREV